MRIQINDLHFTYPSGVEALRDVSLAIEPGEQVAIVGQNGADLVGPLPEAIQNYTIFAMGAATGAKDMDAAMAFITFLKGPAAAAAMKARGLQPN